MKLDVFHKVLRIGPDSDEVLDKCQLLLFMSMTTVVVFVIPEPSSVLQQDLVLKSPELRPNLASEAWFPGCDLACDCNFPSLVLWSDKYNAWHMLCAQ